MKGLYDIHCHILPGVDDGARNMEESLWMLNKEYQEGVRHVILTPHFRYDMFEPHMNIVTRQFMQLRRAAMNIGDEGMRLYLGCELHSSMDMVECLKKGRRLTLAGSRYVLVEFSNGDEKNYIEERVRSLLMNGFIPIIAHVERYKATRNDIGFLTELKDMGAHIQVNADTISGQDGFGAKTFARKVMKHGLLDFVGSDGHRKTERIPEIGKCVAKMEKTMGSEYVKKIFIKNPRKITGSWRKEMENQTVNNNDEVEIDLGEVFHLLLSKLGVIILSGIVFCLAAVMGTMLLITPKYESTTKIVVLSKQDSSTLTNQDIQTSTSLTKDYAELIKSRTVTEGVIAQLKLDMTHEELLKKLSVDTPTDTRVVSITVTDTDPYTAAQIANAVRDIASKHIQQVMDIKAVNVVETANIPDEPSSPSVPKNGVIGGLLGILLAAAVVIIVYLTNDTVKTPEDVEKYLGLSVLGTIPYSSKMGKKSKKKKKRHA